MLNSGIEKMTKKRPGTQICLGQFNEMMMMGKENNLRL
jgi:hypothetical protein